MEYQSYFGVYALVARAGKILLIKKALGCYTGLYDLPGGSMEPHELLEETLKREVLEETGCTVTRPTQLGTFSVLYPLGGNATLRHIGAVYRAEISGTPRETSDGTDDSAGCVWVSVKDITTENAAPFVVQAVKLL